MPNETALVESPSTDHLLSTLTPAELKEWRETGALPDKTSEDSSPPSPGAEATERAAPEPAKQNRRKGAPERIQQLLDEVKSLKAQLAAKPAEKVAESVSAEKPTTAKNPKTGQPWKDWDEYQDARDAWVRDEAKREAREALKVEREASAKAEIESKTAEARDLQEKKISKTLDGLRAKYEDFDAVLFTDELKDAKGPIKKGTPLDRIFVEWSDGPEILYRLARDGQIEEISALSEADQWLKLAEAKLSLSPSAKPKPRVAGPAREIAGTGTAPTNPIEAAVKAGDVRRYIQLQNAEDARRRRG